MSDRDASPGFAALILAAGGSRRWGRGSKLLAPWDGGTVLEAAMEGARSAGLEPTVVVLGDRARRVARALPADVQVVRHPGWRSGRASSLAAGVRALARREGVRAAAVFLGDEPRVPTRAVRAVLEAWEEGGADAVRPLYRDRPGHPVVFGRSCFPELEALEGEEGVRRWLEEHGERVRTVSLDLPAPADVDTREDLRRLRGGEGG